MHPDIVVVGAGVIGAACAHALTVAGLRVTVLDRGAPASATTASGEGNVLVTSYAVHRPDGVFKLRNIFRRHSPNETPSTHYFQSLLPSRVCNEASRAF